MGKAIVILIMLIGIGCAPGGGGTTTGNGIVDVNMQAYTGLSSKVSSMAVTSLTMCFKRLRFKTEGESTDADPSTDSDNIDLSLGEITLSATGTNLGLVSVPYGTYSRVEFDLEKDCVDTITSNSVEVTNGNGSFFTEDRITIKFEGTFVVGSSSNVLNLGVQAIVDALDSVSANEQIKTQAEAVSGTY
ncbi:MAG: hypothetical protein R2827_14435 [Bdellovibrionales bacterium]